MNQLELIPGKLYKLIPCSVEYKPKHFGIYSSLESYLDSAIPFIGLLETKEPWMLLELVDLKSLEYRSLTYWCHDTVALRILTSSSIGLIIIRTSSVTIVEATEP